MKDNATHGFFFFTSIWARATSGSKRQDSVSPTIVYYNAAAFRKQRSVDFAARAEGGDAGPPPALAVI